MVQSMITSPTTKRRIVEADIDGVSCFVTWQASEALRSSQSDDQTLPRYYPLAVSQPARMVVPAIDTGAARVAAYIRLLASDVTRLALVYNAVHYNQRATVSKRAAKVFARLGYRTEYLVIPVPRASWSKEPDMPRKLYILYVYADGNETGITETVTRALYQPYLRDTGRPIIAALVLGMASGVSYRLADADQPKEHFKASK